MDPQPHLTLCTILRTHLSLFAFLCSLCLSFTSWMDSYSPERPLNVFAPLGPCLLSLLYSPCVTSQTPMALFCWISNQTSLSQAPAHVSTCCLYPYTWMSHGNLTLDIYKYNLPHLWHSVMWVLCSVADIPSNFQYPKHTMLLLSSGLSYSQLPGTLLSPQPLPNYGSKEALLLLGILLCTLGSLVRCSSCVLP